MNVSSTKYVKPTRSDLERRAVGLAIGACVAIVLLGLVHLAARWLA